MGGRQYDKCPVCASNPEGDQGWFNPKWALYIRAKGKGFVRVGWLFQRCGHAVIEEEKARAIIGE
jgi:hypothetical protein